MGVPNADIIDVLAFYGQPGLSPFVCIGPTERLYGDIDVMQFVFEVRLPRTVGLAVLLEINGVRP